MSGVPRETNTPLGTPPERSVGVYSMHGDSTTDDLKSSDLNSNYPRYSIENDELLDFRRVSLLWLALIALFMVPMATLVDVPIARWFSHGRLPAWLDSYFQGSVIYAHGTGIFIVLTGVILLSPKRRRYVPRVAALAMGAGAVATMIKGVVLRPRPSSLYLDGASGDYAWIWSFDWTLSHVATFDAASRAFPSATFATATAMTVGLWVVVPRARWIFVALCLGSLGQRVSCGAHFVSDLLGSASVGLAWAYVCFHPKLLGKVFDKMEPDSKTKYRSRMTPTERNEMLGGESVDDAEGTAMPPRRTAA